MKPGTILISIKSNAEVKVSDYDSGTDTFSGTDSISVTGDGGTGASSSSTAAF